MAHDLKYCPFCGEKCDLKVREGYWQLFDLPSAQVVCGHCSAGGSRFLNETIEEATASAIQNWNECYRRPRLLAWLSREWNTLRNRLGL